jgi:hypothetical protein
MRYAIALLAASVAVALAVAGVAPAKSPRVLLVGKNGTYKTIQSAVNAAKPGDWILIAPGDYKETVRIRKDNLHLRGMSRSRVIVDGTKSGPPCSSKEKDQVFNRGDKGNGIEVFKANNVSIDNLTACNFLGEGNQIWWNGGDGSGKIGMTGWYGVFLTATTTYFHPDKPQATYGIFASNAKGPGKLTNAYASNMNDAGFYVGACHPCNTRLGAVHGEFNRLGYSGTNSSGVTIDHSEFNNNFTGISTDSENNDDAPSPQLGSRFQNNFVHDNNDPNVPSTPEGLKIVGVGIIVTGGRNNKVLRNRVEDNGAWGIVMAPFPDVGRPPKVAHCQGGVESKNDDGTVSCYFDDFNNEVAFNTLKNNGFFGNPTNGDLLDISGQNDRSNCWHGNVRADGSEPSAEPSDLQTAHATCGVPGHGDDLSSEAAAQAICASELTGPCPDDATHHYPRTGTIKLHNLPKLKGMPNPCEGVPKNRWC